MFPVIRSTHVPPSRSTPVERTPDYSVGDCPQGYTVCTRVQMNTKVLIKELSGSRSSCRVVGSAKLGYWHPSAALRGVSGLMDSHALVFHPSPLITRQDVLF